MEHYDQDFFREQADVSRRSAEVIVPLVLELTEPRHVIDVGCGIGTWLSVFHEYGVEGIWGVDGDWVDRNMLLIPEERFIRFDLRKPLKMEREFDLVVSLEVAEHLPPESAPTFVASLTRLGPVVLFSAAIPFQGGRHHLNEQWPDYWARLFLNKGYVIIDSIRKKIWQDENVAFYYAQNLLMFARRDRLEGRPQLQQEVANTATSQLSIVHPKKYLALSDPANMSLKNVLLRLPILTRDIIRARLRERFWKK